MRPLRYSILWLTFGWFAVAAVIVLSLIALPGPLQLAFPYADKLQHFMAYALLMGWFVQLFQNRWMLLAHALFLVGAGVALEYAQQHTGRFFDYADMLANGIGVLCGLLLLLTPWHSLLLRWERRFLRPL